MFIREFIPGARFEGFLRVVSAESRTGANGMSFLNINLADSTGTINAKLWNSTVPAPEAGSIVKIRGGVIDYKGMNQLRIERMRLAQPGDENDYDIQTLTESERVPDPPKPIETVQLSADTAGDLASQKPISELRGSEQFKGFLLVRTAEQRSNPNGKNFIDMTLSDRSGSINAKVWDGTIQPPPAGSVILVNATGNEFNGRMQLRVNSFKVVEDTSSIDLSVMIPCAPEKPEAMLAEIMDILQQLPDRDYRELAIHLIRQCGDAILTFPAAKQMHHAERGGLLHHTLTILRAAQGLLKVYPELNPSILLAGCAIHDLAKLNEMDTDPMGLVSDYSVSGKLIGHLVRGVVDIELAGRAIGADPAKVLILQHMILSHHGIPEFGSPIPPKFPEADVLSALDNLDAHLFQMFEALRRAEPGSFSDKVWGLDSRQVYRIPED